ncbi:MAG TPA: hypothetical protein VFD97_03995 [Acidimicrobiia bacterium]|nr:hypothetical protein [Acidimicrobiia bacterium]
MDDTADLLRRTAELAIRYLESMDERPVFPHIEVENLRARLAGAGDRYLL